MNSKWIAGALILVSAGLGFGLYRINQRAESDRQGAAELAANLSNQWVNVTQKLGEEQKVNSRLNTDLSARIEELGVYSNRWTFVASELNRTETEAKAAAASARAEIERRDKQISGLENEKDELGKKMNELNGQIDTLGGQIRETERKLAASEGDRSFLQGELKRLLTEKAELERKFADLAVLRDQVKKLKEELSIARRVELIRRGLFGVETKGGAALLNSGIKKPVPAAETRPKLEGEIHAPAPAPAAATPPK